VAVALSAGRLRLLAALAHGQIELHALPLAAHAVPEAVLPLQRPAEPLVRAWCPQTGLLYAAVRRSLACILTGRLQKWQERPMQLAVVWRRMRVCCRSRVLLWRAQRSAT
jgi:hypothetical protein